jgi:hypothetical protein
MGSAECFEMTDTAGETPAPDAKATPETPATPPLHVVATKMARLHSFLGENKGVAVLAFAAVAVLAIVIGSHWPVLTGTTPAPPRVVAEPAAPPPVAAVIPPPQPATTAPAPAPQTAAPPNPNVTLTDVATRMGGVESRMNTIENSVAHAADREVQAALQERVNRLEAESSGEALRRAGAVLALAVLAHAAYEGRPYKVQFDALAALSPDDPALAALAPYAATGAPTLAMLQARFPEAARAALDAERAVKGGGVFDRLWSSLTSLVHIRRVGDVTGTTSADKLARAEADVSRADLPGAVTEVLSLEGPAASPMDMWVKDAQSRFTIDTALAQAEARIVYAVASQQQAAVPAPTRSASGAPP